MKQEIELILEPQSTIDRIKFAVRKVDCPEFFFVEIPSLYVPDYSFTCAKQMTFLNYVRITHFTSHDEWTEFHSDTLLELFGKHYKKDVINPLIAIGAIEVDGAYKKDVRCKRYRMRYEWLQSNIIPYRISYKGIAGRVYQRRCKQHQKANANQLIREAFRVMDKVELDIKTVCDKIDEEITDPVKKESYICWLGRFMRKDFHGTVDSNGRLHTNITNCPKLIRFCMKMEGKKLVEYDVVSCQPFLLLGIMKDEDEKRRWYELIKKDIYTEIGKIIGSSETRDELKIRFYKEVLFGKNHVTVNSKIFKELRKEFPKLCQTILDIKKGDYKAMARELQKFESDIVLGRVSLRCRILGLDVLTVHDSLFVKPEDKDVVSEIFDEEFERYMGYKPVTQEK